MTEKLKEKLVRDFLRAGAPNPHKEALKIPPGKEGQARARNRRFGQLVRGSRTPRV